MWLESMEFISEQHRFGEDILRYRHPEAWLDICDVISSISDEDVINLHESKYHKSKSISLALNSLIRDKFLAKNWEKESYLFAEDAYRRSEHNRASGVWRLDFANPDGSVSVEVSYNHGEALAWNLLKPVLASELNHVDKAIQTEIGVVILATQRMKEAGGFDGTVGTFEKAVQYLRPLMSQLTVPLVLVGLQAPVSFKVYHVKVDRHFEGRIQRI